MPLISEKELRAMAERTKNPTKHKYECFACGDQFYSEYLKVVEDRDRDRDIQLCPTCRHKWLEGWPR